MVCSIVRQVRFEEKMKKEKKLTIFLVYPAQWREHSTVSNDTSSPYTLKISAFNSASDMLGCQEIRLQRNCVSVRRDPRYEFEYIP